jgi:hypothetical protein
MSKYIDQKKLFEEIIKSKEKNELTPEALNMLVLIAGELSKVLKFKYEEDRKDCIAFAIEDLIRYWRNFNPEKSNNAFAYYTQIAKNGLAKGWKKLRGRTQNIKIININETEGLSNI